MTTRHAHVNARISSRFDEMFDDFCDDIASSMFDKFPLTDEQNELVERLAREEIEKIEWKKAIVVYICP